VYCGSSDTLAVQAAIRFVPGLLELERQMRMRAVAFWVGSDTMSFSHSPTAPDAFTASM
jgi:hypothetical protein